MIDRSSSSCCDALYRLPLAAGLASVLALRPRRRGTPQRQAPVIQTQIILAIVGAVVMLVVGSSLARAFGIVGAAGLVRYRAKIDDPKDAGVMLSTLAIGLAVGRRHLDAGGVHDRVHARRAVVIESFEKAHAAFELKSRRRIRRRSSRRSRSCSPGNRLEFTMRTISQRRS